MKHYVGEMQTVFLSLDEEDHMRQQLQLWHHAVFLI